MRMIKARHSKFQIYHDEQHQRIIAHREFAECARAKSRNDKKTDMRSNEKIRIARSAENCEFLKARH
jgi:hypothetical protein